VSFELDLHGVHIMHAAALYTLQDAEEFLSEDDIIHMSLLSHVLLHVPTTVQSNSFSFSMDQWTRISRVEGTKLAKDPI
jgi:hypothetical protein